MSDIIASEPMSKEAAPQIVDVPLFSGPNPFSSLLSGAPSVIEAPMRLPEANSIWTDSKPLEQVKKGS